ncbi:hypothetical protein C8F04DRAFT_1264986 [Mycena alexandri]|uniref:Uncharacterized protein n=1 Tax=Mycena alexandri TaxID=1745969 RepID=A0AAD6SKN4_9AGAR|nr:hypothetical protein C8F04DRAFT_1264986 [Mycena alexandri]
MPLAPTNMTAEEMIPDTQNAAHNPRFWCLPPTRDSPSEGGHHGGNYPMYLVSQGWKVGIWHNWTVVKTMVDGYPSGAQRGHRTVEGCVHEWQLHCALGVHPHMADPQAPARPVEAELQRGGQEHWIAGLAALGLGGESVSSASSVSSETTSTELSSVAGPSTETAGARYYAIWGSRVVYTDREEAKSAFLAAEAEGLKPRVLATTNYDEGEAFAGAVYWVD